MNLIEDYVQAIWGGERDYYAQRGQTVTDEQWASYLDAKRAQAAEIAESFHAPTYELIKRLRQGMLDPCNKATRKLYTAITGRELPKGTKATDAHIAEHYGEYFERRRQWEVAEAAYAAEQAAKAQSIIRDTAATTWREGGLLPADSFLELCRHHGIDLHPRTIGAIRNRIMSVGPTSFYGTGKVPAKLGEAVDALTHAHGCNRWSAKNQRTGQQAHGIVHGSVSDAIAAIKAWGGEPGDQIVAAISGMPELFSYVVASD